MLHYSLSWGEDITLQEPVYEDLLRALRGAQAWDEVPMHLLSPADRRFVAKWREEATPADLYKHVLVSRLTSTYTRRLEAAVNALVGEGVLSETDVHALDLERVYVLASALAYSETRSQTLARWLRPIRSHLDAAKAFIRLWASVAEYSRPIGSYYNPSPTLVAALSRRPALATALRRYLKVLAESWLGWHALGMRPRRAAALARGLDAFARLNREPPARPGIVGDVVRIGKLRTTNARMVAAFAFLMAGEGEDPWERASTYLRHPYRLARDADRGDIRPGTVAAMLWPGWENIAPFLRGAYQIGGAEFALAMLPYASSQAFDLAMEAEAWAEDDYLYPTALAVAFNKRMLRQYTQLSRRAGWTLHDAALPFARVLQDTEYLISRRLQAARALARYLLAWLPQRQQWQSLQTVARHWMLLAPQFPDAGSAPSTVLPRILRILRENGEAVGEDIPPIALPLYLHHKKVTGRRARWEERWVKSLTVPSPFPLRQSWRRGKLTGRFLPRWDPRGIDLGELTNSCQHPGGAGESSAWHGQEDPLGGYFVVETAKGEIVAMSWTWWRPGEGVCFDNIEALGLGGREDAVAAIYTAAAQFLADHGYGVVTVGKGNSDLNGDAYWPTAERPLQPPAGVYTDARRQWLVATGEATRTYATPEYEVRVVFAPLPPDVREGMERVAEAAYPQGWDFVDNEDPDLYLVLTHEGEVAGYAAVETANRYINDIAVGPAHRGQGAMRLMSSLLAVMRGIAVQGEEWSADMRESTSFALLQLLARRGRVTITSVKETEDRIGEDRVFAVRFAITGA